MSNHRKLNCMITDGLGPRSKNNCGELGCNPRRVNTQSEPDKTNDAQQHSPSQSCSAFTRDKRSQIQIHPSHMINVSTVLRIQITVERAFWHSILPLSI